MEETEEQFACKLQSVDFGSLHHLYKEVNKEVLEQIIDKAITFKYHTFINEIQYIGKEVWSIDEDKLKMLYNIVKLTMERLIYFDDPMPLNWSNEAFLEKKVLIPSKRYYV